LAPSNDRGMTYQTDENNMSKKIRYLVGVVNIEFYCLNTHLLLHVINQKSSEIFIKSDIEKLIKCYVFEFLGHPGLHHTFTQG